MKNRKTNFIKLGILLFGISLFLFNCEKEDEAFISQTKFKYKIEKVTFTFYQNNTTLLKKVDEFNVTKRAIDIQNKTDNSDKKYTINTKEAIYIENNEGTHHTYTFEISNNDPLELQNIVLSLQDDGNYKAFLTTYQITKQERIDLYNGVSVDLSERTSIKEININQVEYANKVGGGCYELEKVGEEWCNHTDHTVEAHILQGGYCNHPTSIYAWVEEPCPGETGSGSPSVPLNGSDGTLYNSGGSSSTNGGTITTSPIALECDNCSNSLSLISYLNLTEQSQIDWVNNTGNSLTVNNLSNFGDANQWDENTTTISLQILNALSNTTNPSLSFEENITIKNKATEIFDIIASNNFSNIDQFSLADQKTIAQNSLFIGFLPSVNSIIGQYWPKSTEEWAVIGELFTQFLPELALGFIPGSDILEVIKGVDNGDTIAVAFGLAGLIADAFGGTILKGLTKAVKIGKKIFTSFKLTYKFVAVIGKALKTGLKVSLDGTTVILKRNLNEIARITNNVMNFKYSGFGGNIITNPNKTTTLIGKWDGQLENIWDTGLAKQGNNSGGLNVLGNVSRNVQEQWIQNRNWINQAIARGDVIRVTANPVYVSNFIFNNVDNVSFSNWDEVFDYMNTFNASSTKFDNLGFFGKEIHTLINNGYNFNPITNLFEL